MRMAQSRQWTETLRVQTCDLRFVPLSCITSFTLRGSRRLTLVRHRNGFCRVSRHKPPLARCPVPKRTRRQRTAPWPRWRSCRAGASWRCWGRSGANGWFDFASIARAREFTGASRRRTTRATLSGRGRRFRCWRAKSCSIWKRFPSSFQVAQIRLVVASPNSQARHQIQITRLCRWVIN